jgi:serine/threonine protein phosphatase PrpC
MQILLKSITGRVRETDEDSVFGLSAIYAGQGMTNERSVLALADGMGGGSAGEIASSMFITSVKEQSIPLIQQSSSPTEDEVVARIRAAVTQANERINEFASKQGLHQMGTTGVVAYVEGSNAVVGNVGDSRLYVVNKGGMTQVTRDHSYVQGLFERGLISKDEMRTHPEKNLITKAIGLDPTVEPDIFKFRIFGDDLLLLCCDGLWEAMPERDLHKLIFSKSPKEALDSLIETANTLDGSDNISAVLGIPTMLDEEIGDYVKMETKEVTKVATAG